ncbi:MAG: GTPase domain-containing protein [Rubrivivax sp.]|nr:GTPase domain-containing protein [Rubrivivax sp.]
MGTTVTTVGTVTLSLVSHTNVGKTTLARTLLAADIGEVRDAPHVTEFADGHELIATPEGDRLRLWDTPGFGDSARLVQRLRREGSALGWFLSQVWDRWRDRAFWSSQRALHHVREQSDVVLYLVNAAESPAAAGYVGPEMELLQWVGKPVLVLLNQLGAPRAPAEEAADVAAWRTHLASWPLVRGVLPLDAFARCWVHESRLLHAVQALLQDAGERDKAAAMARLTAAWTERRERTFDAAMQALAGSLGRIAVTRIALDDAGGGLAGLGGRLRDLGSAVLGREGSGGAAAAAQRALAQALEAEVRDSTQRLLELHGLAGRAGDAALAQVLERVAGQVALRERVDEGRAAVIGGAVTGALAGLKADLASGGLTLGGGLIAGGLLGALGAAGVARGINLVRGTDRSWAGWQDAALGALVEAALLRYLAVAHFGRGRGEWVQGEAPPHWPQAVAEAMRSRQAAFAALWASRSERPDQAADGAQAERLAAALQPLLRDTVRELLRRLYPDDAPGGAPTGARPATAQSAA